MLEVRTKLGQSGIHGTGLFAAESIVTGTRVWIFDPGVDIRFSKKRLLSYPKPALEWFYHNMWLGKISHSYCMHGDDARFINSSDEPNLVVSHDPAVSNEYIAHAGRDIIKGEELTWCYPDFDAIDPSIHSVWCKIEEICGIVPDAWEAQFTDRERF